MQGVESVWDGYMKTSIDVEHAMKAGGKSVDIRNYC